MSDVIAPNACAVNEQTADGLSVGRCWFNLDGDICPRHGDVSEVMAHHRATGRLTPESSIRRVGPERERGENDG